MCEGNCETAILLNTEVQGLRTFIRNLFVHYDYYLCCDEDDYKLFKSEIDVAREMEKLILSWG